MINPENYLSKKASIDLTSLPMPLQKGHEFLMKATADATDWNNYHNSSAIRKTIQLYFERLADYLTVTEKANKKKEDKEVKKKQTQSSTEDKNIIKASKKSVNDKNSEQEKASVIMVERMPEELRFIKRFIHLNGKTKTKDEILRFVNSLQKAILEKRIRKTSSYADQVRLIQEKLIELYNTMKAKVKVELKQDTYESLKMITGGEKVMPSINFIKRYIGMNGKAGMKEKAKQLLAQINRALDKGKITDSDLYTSEIYEIKKNLKTFTTTKTEKTLEIEKAELNGLQGILGGHASKKKLYDTEEKKLKAVRKRGNIITFKQIFYPRGTENEGYTQILVTGIRKEKSGAIKIE